MKSQFIDDRDITGSNFRRNKWFENFADENVYVNLFAGFLLYHVKRKEWFII